MATKRRQPAKPPRRAGPKQPKAAAAGERRPVRSADTRSGPAGVRVTETVAREGGCHCGAITYTYMSARVPRRWPVRICGCNFCRAHGVRWTSDPAGEVRFWFERPEYLRRYRFALRTVDFVICKECGVCVAGVLLSGRGAQAMINVNTLHAPPAGIPAGRHETFTGESAEARRFRRGELWTPVAGPV